MVAWLQFNVPKYGYIRDELYLIIGTTLLLLLLLRPLNSLCYLIVAVLC